MDENILLKKNPVLKKASCVGHSLATVVGWRIDSDTISMSIMMGNLECTFMD